MLPSSGTLPARGLGEGERESIDTVQYNSVFQGTNQSEKDENKLEEQMQDTNTLRKEPPDIFGLHLTLKQVDP